MFIAVAFLMSGIVLILLHLWESILVVLVTVEALNVEFNRKTPLHFMYLHFYIAVDFVVAVLSISCCLSLLFRCVWFCWCYGTKNFNVDLSSEGGSPPPLAIY